jgi:hypothetical protein
MKITYLRRDNEQIITNTKTPGQIGNMGMAYQFSTDQTPGTSHVDSIEFLEHVGAYLLKREGFKDVIIPLAKTYYALGAADEPVAEKKPAKKVSAAA